MKSKSSLRFLSLAVCLCVSLSVHAQDLIPATSEDIDQFDQELARQQAEREKQSGAQKKSGTKENFGAAVSAEAKKLNASGDAKKNEFGQWVSGQRKKNDQGRPSASETGSEKRAQNANQPSADVRGNPGNGNGKDSSGRGNGRGNGKNK